MPDDTPHPGRLKRELGLFHAVLLGLGSILGTGVFVSIGIATGIAGPAVLIAIVLAALLALCNGLSSAQLAAAHPIAGGTYEYGYKYLHPKLGFTAGWMFLLAKSASAATAALAVSGLLGMLIDEPSYVWVYQLIAVLIVACVTGLVLAGLRRSTHVNAMMVGITVMALVIFIVSGLDGLCREHAIGGTVQSIAEVEHWPTLLGTVALMFVAYTGYGRIATLGEEVHHPRRTIPSAIIVTLAVSAMLYLGVGFVLAGTFYVVRHGIDLDQPWQAETLDIAINWLGLPVWISVAVSLAAITAMLGVLLNLVLGLSRVLLAMGRRRDMPGVFEKVNAAGTTPVPAVIGVGVLIAGLTLIGDIKTTWSFAAFTVLIYYGVTNLAALRIPKENRLYPRVFAWAGLGGCLFLCWFVPPVIWMVGLGLIGVGLVWHTLTPKMFGDPPSASERCVACGYDLRASTGQCPECGQAIPDEAVT